MKIRLRRALFYLHFVITASLVSYAIWQLSPSSNPFQKTLTQPDRIDLNSSQLVYLATSTLDYRDSNGHLRLQQYGALGFGRHPLPATNEIAHLFACRSTVDACLKYLAETDVSPAALIYNPRDNRYVGGDTVFQSLGVLANAALSQVRSRFIPNGTVQTASFHYVTGLPLMPDQMHFRLTGAPLASTNGGSWIAVTAISEPFAILPPDGQPPIEATLRSFTVTDSGMEITLLRAVRFEAKTPQGVLATEHFMVLAPTNSLVDLSPWQTEIQRAFRDLGFEQTKPQPLKEPAVALPPWALHALIARNVADILAAAAVEGRPNFEIVATIGLILLVDSLVSAGTTLLHEAGVIDWEWKGIPNLIGSTIGGAVAAGYNRAAGREILNEDCISRLGGIAGDVLSLALPSRWLHHGARVSVSFGAKSVKLVAKSASIPLAGKSIRISNSGLQLVRGRTSFARSISFYEKAEGVRSALDATFATLDFTEYVRECFKGESELPPPQIGDLSFRLYWIPPRDDIDLHVMEPSGETISFRNMTSRSGGRLDRDDRTSGGPENIYWPESTAPSGLYRCLAHYYEGVGPRTVVIEIREGHVVKQTRLFTLEAKDDRTPVIEWSYRP